MEGGGFLNLTAATALVVDDNEQSLDQLVGVLMSFGTRQVLRAENAKTAMELIENQTIDLVMTDAVMPEMDGYDLVRWLRQHADRERKITPVIIITAHTRQTDVLRARDCGANFIIAKPIAPKVVLDRILWVARGDRLFIESDSYRGPDRRYKILGPPPEFPEGRRRTDVRSGLESDGQDEVLSTDEIDQMVKPQKVT